MPQAHLASGFAAGLGLVCDIEAKPSRPMVMTESNMWDCVQAHEVSALGEALREMEREGGWMCGGVGECVRTKQRSSSALKLLQAVKHTSCVSWLHSFMDQPFKDLSVLLQSCVVRRSTRTHVPRMARSCTAIPRPGAYRPRLAYSIRWSSFLYLVRLYDEGEALAAEAARDDLMREAAVELGDAFLVSRSTHALSWRAR